MTHEEMKKKAPMVVTWAGILAALGLGITAMGSANSLENLALANQKDIFYERAIRETSSANLESQLGELDEDIDELKDEVTEEAKEIKDLLNQLLLREAAPIN